MANPGLGDKINDWLERNLPSWLEAIIDIINFPARIAGSLIFKGELPDLPGIWGEIQYDVSHDILTPEKIAAYGTRMRSEGGPLGWLATAWYWQAILAVYMIGASGPAARVANYRTEALIKSGRLDPENASRAWWMGSFSDVELTQTMRDLGYSGRLMNVFQDLTRTQLPADQLIALWLRDELAGENIDTRLRELGVAPADVQNIKTLSHLIPGPSDLVRMAIREAWRDDVAAKWGYDQDYVAEFGQWMEKQGMSEEWAKRYWRAHWELPSLTMAREMVHRTAFTDSDFKDLLRIADIPAGYRDYLNEVIYTPYTRVDVRRMYNLGVLDYDDVVKSYRELGFDAEKAANMAEFTVRFYVEEEREATKADIVGAYTDDLLARERASELLQSIDYPDWLVDLYLNRADLDKSNALTAETIRYCKTLYTNYQIDRTGVYSTLGAINLPDTRIDRLLEEWDIAREPKVARPSVSKLEAYYLRDIISSDDFVFEMRAHKFPDKYISWSQNDILRKKKEEADKEEERARKEQERLAASELRTDRDLVLAGLTVLIAQARCAIADIELALIEPMEEDTVLRLQKAILEYKLLIAQTNIEIAEVREAYYTELSEG